MPYDARSTQARFETAEARGVQFVPPLFQWLQAQGRMASAELARTFNCGIGMVLAVPPHQAEAVTVALTESGESVFTIGTIVSGPKGCEVRGGAGLWGQAEGWTAVHDA